MSAVATTSDQTARERFSRGVKALEGDRIIAILGAVLVIVATAVTWYSRDVTVTIGGITTNSSTGVSLWDVRELAAWLVTGGAVFGALMPFVLKVDERSAGNITAFAGFAIGVYSAISIFDMPNLGSGVIQGALAHATVTTSVGAGPFLALAAGIMLSIGGIATMGDAAIAEMK
jgi:hypothetical protein